MNQRGFNRQPRAKSPASHKTVFHSDELFQYRVNETLLGMKSQFVNAGYNEYLALIGNRDLNILSAPLNRHQRQQEKRLIIFKKCDPLRIF
tara:strand:+ start:3548 stop:3820 length:273 start_codon:yes stop_codon:yes gene_type:complete